MAADEEYQALWEDTRDALRALLKDTDVQYDMTAIRAAYRHSLTWLEKNAGSDPEPRLDVCNGSVRCMCPNCQQERSVWRRWKSTPRHERWRAILDVLADDNLPVREVADKVDAMRDDWSVHTAALQQELYKMLEAGEVSREKRLWRHQQTRWHYFRRRQLEGPIVELDRAFHDDEQEAG